MLGKILRTAWRSGIDSVCIVAVDYGNYWQAYIGASRVRHYESISILINEPEPHEVTEQRTAEHGCKLSWQEAQAFFPDLDIEKYKTYNGCKENYLEHSESMLFKVVLLEEYPDGPVESTIVVEANSIAEATAIVFQDWSGILSISSIEEICSYEQFWESKYHKLKGNL